ncbi:Protein MKS1 [Acorus calamus]|uniref:Protein MKS1 n=1 Tax=Acorus calamus TaxID=4465 RepID=A0AAV9ED46_ACOCL|nr:Protein MKS1 [Acorus calamus]
MSSSKDNNPKRLPSKKREPLHGLRPPPLKLSKDSHKLTKKPPIVIYMKSPKIIHARAQDFMNLVQQLTGHVSSSSSSQPPPPSSTSFGRAMIDVNKACEEDSIDDGDDSDRGVKNSNEEGICLMGMPLVPSPMSSGLFLSSPNTYQFFSEFSPIF